MPHLLNVWPRVSQQLRDSAQVLLLFDYDGTLTPIVEHPDAAVLSAPVKELLSRLASSERFLVGVVTGRSLSDISDKVGLSELIYAGNHGLEIRGPGLEFVHEAAMELASVQGPIAAELREKMASEPGVIVEPKGLSLTVHYRMAPDSREQQVKDGFNSVVAPFVQSGSVRITTGKKVLEVRPNIEWDKGKAIVKLQETFPEAGLTIFFGDDRTDEDGFRAVQDSEGVAVFVGPARQPTLALHRVDSPEDVATALELLADI